MKAEIDLSNVVLKTERLVLRPWKEEDADDLYEYAKDKDIAESAGYPPHNSKERSLEIIKHFYKHQNRFAIEYNGKVIGSIGIKKYPEHLFPEFKNKKGADIGYDLSKAYLGRGIMPEAVKEVIRYLFEEVGLDFLISARFSENKQSQRVQGKCGFSYYKTLETTTFKNEEVPIHFTVLMNERIKDER